MPDMMAPPPGCQYDIKFDERGCYLDHKLVCEPTPRPCIMPGLAPPPAGCEYDIVYDSDGCYVSHSLVFEYFARLSISFSSELLQHDTRTVHDAVDGTTARWLPL